MIAQSGWFWTHQTLEPEPADIHRATAPGWNSRCTATAPDLTMEKLDSMLNHFRSAADGDACVVDPAHAQIKPIFYKGARIVWDPT